LNFKLIDIFERHARYLPRKAALVGIRTVTYGEMWSTAGEIARQLADAGLKSGDCVGVVFSASTEYVILIVGMMRAGLVVAPINSRLTSTEIQEYITRLSPRAIITDEEHSIVVSGTNWAYLIAHEEQGGWSIATRSSTRWNQPTEHLVRDLAFIIGTGGSTGIPKGAMISNQAAWMWATCSMYAQQMRQSDVEMFGSPFFHSTVLTGVMTTLAAGATVRVIGHYDVDSVVEAVLRDGGTRLAGAPTMLQRVLESAQSEPLLWRNVRIVQFGSTKAPPGFVENVRRSLPHADLVSGYGSTEFGPVTRIYTPDFLTELDVGVGRPVPAADIIIIDRTSKLAIIESGVEGEIAASCPWQMSGYVGADEETSEVTLASGHIRSGDIGLIDENGYLHLRGRYKEIIITGGENVFPIEVEGVIAEHPAITDVAVYGVTDEIWGERVEAALVLKLGMKLGLDELRSFCRSKLAGFKIPTSIKTLDHLPLTSNLKVDKRRLSRDSSMTTSSE